MNEKKIRMERNQVNEAYSRLSDLFNELGISSNRWADLSLLYRHAYGSLTARLAKKVYESKLNLTEEVSDERVYERV